VRIPDFAGFCSQEVATEHQQREMSIALSEKSAASSVRSGIIFHLLLLLTELALTLFAGYL
jgi:hypothetical protein